VIQKSSNVGAAKIAGMLPSQTMWQMFDDVGFGQVPRLGFPGEVTGRVRPWKSWRPIEQATMAYGHGISVSLIQLARAYSVFARDGDLVPLSLTRVDSADAARRDRVQRQDGARSAGMMLEMAVQPGGTAPKAQIPGYRVAGKTGTAHKLKAVATPTSMSRPSSVLRRCRTRLIVAVMIDEPSAGKHYGGDVAAPVFAAVMGSSLRTSASHPTRRWWSRRRPKTPGSEGQAVSARQTTAPRHASAAILRGWRCSASSRAASPTTAARFGRRPVSGLSRRPRRRPPLHRRRDCQWRGAVLWEDR
jgi:cell division protein FtsI/penicillin-binding protein 2